MIESTKKTIVIYKSKYGSTKKYAEWIAKSAEADLFESTKVKIDDILKYDIIVYGGSLHAVGIKGVKLITENIEKLKDKRVIIFAVGASSPKEEAIQHVIEHNFSKNVLQRIKFFYFRGAINFSKLNFIDKLMMLAMKSMLKKKKELDEEEKGLLDSFDNPVDFTDEKAIAPLIECINQ